MRVGVVISTMGRDSLQVTLKALAQQPYDMLTVVRDYRGNVSHARNEGWKALSRMCDVIAFTDDDCIPSTDWIVQGRKFFEQNPKLSLMQGRVYGGLETSPTFMFVTANMWVKVAALKEVGGFDEEFLYAGEEDLDLGWRMLDKQRGCLFNPECAVEHPTGAQHLMLPFNQSRVAEKHPVRYAKLLSEKSSI